jgi:hypothetical protein
MKPRAQRWPSHWALNLETEHGDYPVKIMNVSESGFKFLGELPAEIGQAVRLKAMGQTVQAHLVRREAAGGAFAFDSEITAAQLANLRQYRDFF